MIGCLVVLVLVVLLFAIVPFPLWPFLVIGLIILFVVAAAMGFLKGVIGILFRRP